MRYEVDLKNFGGWAISIEVFDWIYDNIPSGSTILEFGSGYSTKELVKFYNVYSIEENQRWVDVIKDAKYLYSPLKRYHITTSRSIEWYDDMFIQQIPEKYDLLLIDGPTGSNRQNFIYFYQHFKSDIPYIVDDTHREGDNRMANQLSKLLNKEMIEIKGSEKTATVLK
jgi:hypothetical protein